jgi:hypothetical protein
MNNAQLINQDSGDTEYYTPIEIVNAAREVMGGIDLDPASSEIANRSIGATVFFTKEHDGLSQKWTGKVWLNHPFSREGNRLWIEKLMHEYYEDNFQEACCITFASTSEKWFRELMLFPQCFLSPRTNYCTPDGKKKRGVTKGSVVTYLGNNTTKFIDVFDGSFGTVKL